MIPARFFFNYHINQPFETMKQPTTHTAAIIGIHQEAADVFTLSAELKTGTIFTKRYIFYTKSEAIQLFKAAYQKENDTYFINQPAAS